MNSFMSRNLGSNLTSPSVSPSNWSPTSSIPTSPEIAEIYDFPFPKQVESFILVTGGLGFIGSHTTLQLLQNGFNVIVFDNLSNSQKSVLDRIEFLARDYFVSMDREREMPVLKFHQIDYGDKIALDDVLSQYDRAGVSVGQTFNSKLSKIMGVIHFAAYKAVSESTRFPLQYYNNNVSGLVNLLEQLSDYGIKNFVYSSSATVYGTNGQGIQCIPEECCVQAIEIQEGDCNSNSGGAGICNPYGRTKWMGEAILSDLCVSDPDWRIVILRYFNPIGAHPSGLLGESPLGTPNNLMPVICRVLRGDIPFLTVFGDDYPTVDGTGVRDFIHVCDLAAGHISATRAIITSDNYSVKRTGSQFRTYNLGCGRGYSVLELVGKMEDIAGKQVLRKMTSRRPGDVASCVAKPLRAEKELCWKAELSIDDACRDAWNFISKNPFGFEE